MTLIFPTSVAFWKLPLAEDTALTSDPLVSRWRTFRSNLAFLVSWVWPQSICCRYYFVRAVTERSR